MVVTVTVDMMNARIASVAKTGNKVWIKLLDDVKQSIRNCTVI